MTKGDIEVGAKYTDRRGNIRLVLSILKDRVEYKLIEASGQAKHPLGTVGSIGIKNFAEWAREGVPSPHPTPPLKITTTSINSSPQVSGSSASA